MAVGTFIRHVDDAPGHFYEDWKLASKHTLERIPFVVQYPAQIDSIRFDTWSVPEPVTVTTLVVGLVSLLLARRRSSAKFAG